MDSKAKRNDLKTVGLAFLVTPDYSIPLFTETYPGNRSDSKQFAEMMEQLKQRFCNVLGKDAEITIFFDRGNNSHNNLDMLENEELKFHYIGGLKKNQIPQLYNIDKKKYMPLECPDNASEKYRNLTVYRTETKAFERDVTALIVHNPELEKGQLQGICINIEKTKNELLDIQGRLLKRFKGEITKGKKPTVQSVKNPLKKY